MFDFDNDSGIDTSIDTGGFDTGEFDSEGNLDDDDEVTFSDDDNDSGIDTIEIERYDPENISSASEYDSGFQITLEDNKGINLTDQYLKSKQADEIEYLDSDFEFDPNLPGEGLEFSTESDNNINLEEFNLDSEGNLQSSNQGIFSGIANTTKNIFDTIGKYVDGSIGVIGGAKGVQDVVANFEFNLPFGDIPIKGKYQDSLNSDRGSSTGGSSGRISGGSSGGSTSNDNNQEQVTNNKLVEYISYLGRLITGSSTGRSPGGSSRGSSGGSSGNGKTQLIAVPGAEENNNSQYIFIGVIIVILYFVLWEG